MNCLPIVELSCSTSTSLHFVYVASALSFAIDAPPVLA
jgi:hypothetical protein